MCVFIWRKRKQGWRTRSKISSNHHRLGRVLKHPDSSVPRTERHGRQDEPSPTSICSLAWVRIREGTLLHPRNALARQPVQLRHRQIHQTPFFGRQAANPKRRIKAAKRTSNLTPEGKERRHRLGTRLSWYRFLSWGELWAMGGSLFVLLVFCLYVPLCLLIVCCSIR